MTKPGDIDQNAWEKAWSIVSDIQMKDLKNGLPAGWEVFASIDRIARAIMSAKAEEWQDIATARKDGSRFLGVNAQNRIAIIKWADLMMVRYDPDLHQSVPAYGWVIADGPPVTTFSPIQWQPLPSP